MVENDLKSMGFEARNSPYSGPFTYKEKLRIPVFHLSIFSLRSPWFRARFCLFPRFRSSSGSPPANPHRRRNSRVAGKRRRIVISCRYFSKRYRPNPSPMSRKPYFPGPWGLLIGQLAESPPYREGSEMFYMLVW